MNRGESTRGRTDVRSGGPGDVPVDVHPYGKTSARPSTAVLTDAPAGIAPEPPPREPAARPAGPPRSAPLVAGSTPASASPAPSSSSPFPDARPPVGRLAPSPTGLLHVGHARSFLVAWWHARARGGRIVLRLEDLDQGRVKEGMVERTLADLAWLGLDWDGDPILQSNDAPRHAAALERLVAAGSAYPCTCTRREIELAQSAPHASDGTTRYPGTCRARWRTPADAEQSTGRPAALRLTVPPGPIAFEDGLAGPCRYDVDATVGDFPIARKGGEAAYQLAVAVDDHAQGVSEIVRGDDLLPSTAQQILVQRALGLEHPRWWHLPLVVDEAGRRLAKRSNDLALARLREQGVAAEALVAWIARRSGIPVTEARAGARELVPSFAIERVPPMPVVFGPRDLEDLRSAS